MKNAVSNQTTESSKNLAIDDFAGDGGLYFCNILAAAVFFTCL